MTCVLFCKSMRLLELEKLHFVIVNVIIILNQDELKLRC